RDKEHEIVELKEMAVLRIKQPLPESLCDFPGRGGDGLLRLGNPGWLCGPGLSDSGQKEPFPADPVGEETVADHRVMAHFPDTPRGVRRESQKFRCVVFCEPLEILLVFDGVVGAGAVKQKTAGAESGPDIADNPSLTPRAALHIVRRPFPYGFRILPEQPLTRTRCVDNNHVEVTCEPRKVRRIVVAHDDVGITPFLYVLR